MRTNKVFRLSSIYLAILICAVILAPVKVMAAEVKVDLGSTESFAVLAGSTVTNTGSTVISGSAGGDLGLSPGFLSSVTGFPPGVINDGHIYAGDSIGPREGVALQAKNDLLIAYNDAANRTVTEDLTGQDLEGMTLTSGVYNFDTEAQLTGTLTLDAEGDPEAAFIFQIGSTLTTASESTVILINGAQYCRVFWQVGSSATLGTDSLFIGHIFALTSITATTGAEIQGQLLALNGAVTLDTNKITNGFCAADVPEPDEPEPVVIPTPPPIVTPPVVVPPTPIPVTVDIAADVDVPQTGENSNSGLFIGLMLLSVVGVVAASRGFKKAR